MSNWNWFGLRSALPLLAAVAASCSGSGSGDEDAASTRQAVCSSATLRPTNRPTYSASTGDQVIWTAAAGCTGTPEYSFWVRDTNNVYTNPQPWGPSATFNWTTTGLPAGSYVVTVLVRDATGPTMAYDQYVSNYFSLVQGSPCTSARTTASPTTATVGTNVVFTNTALPCGNPEFLIYHRPPNGAWQIDRQYNTANGSFTWVTANEAPGVHNFQIWVRQQGSTASYEAYSSYSYLLSGTAPCTNARLTFSPNPGTAGTPTTITGYSLGCTTPTYSFYIQPPGGTWQLLQDWTTSPKATWNTTLATPGQYAFQVWVRASGSTAAYETYTGGYYVLNAGTPSTSALAISGSFNQNCEITSAGKVACWGYNANGELGNGTTTRSSLPVAVSGITTAVSLGVGYNHACAVLQGGGVRCWGLNQHGQLGNNSNTSSSTPVVVSGINATRIAAGTAHTCATLADGTVRCWGYNSQGQIGDGTVVNKLTPTVVPGISNAIQTSAGYYHSCAVLNDGTVRCWGQNVAGQLGNGTSTNSRTPVTASVSNVVQISAAANNNCAVKSDHTVWCWGDNSTGIAGDGTTSPHPSPTQVTGITNAVSVAVGPYHACAALQDGTAKCWGYNPYGALGNGTQTDSLVPVAVSTLTNVSSVAVGNYTSCAALADGSAACWGYGGEGALGNGTLKAINTTPLAVSPLP